MTENAEGLQAIGKTVRWHRQEAGMTQAELAEQMAEQGLPWHTSTVSKTESGVREITVRELTALAEVLGTTPADLLEMRQSEINQSLVRQLQVSVTRRRANRLEDLARETTKRNDSAREEIEALEDMLRFWRGVVETSQADIENSEEMARVLRRRADQAEQGGADT